MEAGEITEEASEETADAAPETVEDPLALYAWEAALSSRAADDAASRAEETASLAFSGESVTKRLMSGRVLVACC